MRHLSHTSATGRDGHIGLVVLGSIAGGFAAGAVLDLLIFGGSGETTITGLAVLSLAFGFALLALLSSRRTSQPQAWATVPAGALGFAGAAILAVAPSDRTLVLLGWVWPTLLLALVIWMVRAARGSLRSRSRGALLYPAFGLLALVAVGGALETVAEATTSHSAPRSGHVYAVDGLSLYMACSGTRTPTVLLFNGFQERTQNWARIQKDVAADTRVCTFDRAGEGWSGAAPGPQDGRELAHDLHALLAAARVPGPYVLAGHSVGGTYALVYAQQYPRQVAGVALIDSSTPYQFALPNYPRFYSTWRRVSALFPTMARAGTARIFGLGNPRELRADRDEFAELPTAFKQAQALKTLGHKPLVVLTADVGQQAGWSASQDRLARLSKNSAHRTTHGATHGALLEDQHFAAVTSGAIKAVVVSARSGVSLN
jgi:pimeloyl-ACP methyl ester carboxylesterase